MRLLTLPGRIDAARPLPPVDGIEIADAAPRALDQMQRDHDAVLGIMTGRDIAGVAGTNLHGWGRTAAAWSVMRIPGWRALTPAALDLAIRERLREERCGAVRVVERHRVDPGASIASLAATAPLVGWRMLRSLAPAERASWLAWSWMAWLLARVRASVRRRRDVAEVSEVPAYREAA